MHDRRCSASLDSESGVAMELRGRLRGRAKWRPVASPCNAAIATIAFNAGGLTPMWTTGHTR